MPHEQRDHCRKIALAVEKLPPGKFAEIKSHQDAL